MSAFTAKYLGNQSIAREIQTEVRGPSAPTIVNLTCSSDTLFLSWAKPQTHYKSIDYYFVHYRPENSREFHHIKLPNREQLEVSVNIATE